jgi:phosphoribosylanthranilate isomerase
VVTRVKICGITNVDDAQAAVDAGADALGFIFVHDSPRWVTTDQVWDISRAVGPFVTRVGVYRDAADFTEVAAYCLDACQYYTNERGVTDFAWARRIPAIRVLDDESLDLSRVRGADAVLLDAYHRDRLGGSGETFNWDLALVARERFGLPIILAGGLTPENVGEAVRRVRPYAVDVSSGVEASPGHKDHAKILAFIQAVRSADEDS